MNISSQIQLLLISLLGTTLSSASKWEIGTSINTLKDVPASIVVSIENPSIYAYSRYYKEELIDDSKSPLRDLDFFNRVGYYELKIGGSNFDQTQKSVTFTSIYALGGIIDAISPQYVIESRRSSIELNTVHKAKDSPHVFSFGVKQDRYETSIDSPEFAEWHKYVESPNLATNYFLKLDLSDPEIEEVWDESPIYSIDIDDLREMQYAYNQPNKRNSDSSTIYGEYQYYINKNATIGSSITITDNNDSEDIIRFATSGKKFWEVGKKQWISFQLQIALNTYNGNLKDHWSGKAGLAYYLNKRTSISLQTQRQEQYDTRQHSIQLSHYFENGLFGSLALERLEWNSRSAPYLNTTNDSGVRIDLGKRF